MCTNQGKDALRRMLFGAFILSALLIIKASAQTETGRQPDELQKNSFEQQPIGSLTIAATTNNTAEPARELANGESGAQSILVSVLTNFYNPQDGLSINDLISRALQSNEELAAARIDTERARARLRQARLRPNPTLEVEQTSGRFVGNGGDGELSVGFSLPFEVYGLRQARINVAEIEIEASEALVRNRERQLTATVLTNYAEALAALKELEATEKLLELDLQTTRFVQIRVNEGETPPLELNLLQAEVERLRARRELAVGRLNASLTQIKLLVGIPFEDPLVLREQIETAVLPALPATREAAFEIALRIRPDVRLAQIEEQVATAGLRLIRAQAKPDLTAYTRYSQGRSGFTDSTGGDFINRDRALTFGIAVGLPIFNKNQGARAEAELSISQAQRRREYAVRVVRSEITSAYQRIEAAARAVAMLETGALPRSTENVATFRKVYEIGNITITDLITEQRRLLDATRDLTEALTERYRAQADLNIALGASALLP